MSKNILRIEWTNLDNLIETLKDKQFAITEFEIAFPADIPKEKIASISQEIKNALSKLKITLPFPKPIGKTFEIGKNTDDFLPILDDGDLRLVSYPMPSNTS